MTIIKICGLSQTDHAVFAAETGADLLGFIFAQSRRQIAPEKAALIIKNVKNTNRGVEVVGVFADAQVSEVNTIADYCALDRVQLCGKENWDYCRKVDRPLIKVIHIAPDTSGEVISVIEEGRQLLKEKKVTFLLDSHNGTQSGGTGRVFNWEIAKNISSAIPVMVAGGLNPENVVRLMHDVHPLGVDVSSGVETNGVKDPALIEAFIRSVRQTDSRSGK